MKLSLRVILTATFLAITLLSFLSVIILANTLLDRQFRQYVLDKLDRRMQDAAELVTSRWDERSNRFRVESIEAVGMNLLAEGLILKVTGADGSVVWDANKHNGGMCTAMLQQMARNMQKYSPDFRGGYEETRLPVIAGVTQVGAVTIGYYGPYFFTDYDIRFLSTLNRLLLWAALAAALASAAIGVLAAGRLSKPIRSVIGTAQRIAKGDYGGRVRTKPTTKELFELTAAVNSLAETLGRQDEARKRLTADVAHELRTPLATLQSHLEAMIDGVWPADEIRLKSCHEEAVRLTRLVGSLEQLARADSDSLSLDKARIDLSALLRRVVTNFEGPFQAKGVELAFEPAPMPVTADEDKLSQVFVNLLSNALKHTPEGGLVSVGMQGGEGAASVTVRDTGAGIAPEDMPYIFGRLWRADKSRSRETGGSGIGLAVAKSIVEAHGGIIEAESVPGKGSVFTVTLPAGHE